MRGRDVARCQALNRDIAWLDGRTGTRGRRRGGGRAHRARPSVRRRRGRGTGREDQLGDRQASGRKAGTAGHPAQHGRMDEPGHGPGLSRARHRRNGRDAAFLAVQRSRTQGSTRCGLIPGIPSDEHQLGEYRPGDPHRADLGRHCGYQHRLRPAPFRSALSGTTTPRLVRSELL